MKSGADVDKIQLATGSPADGQIKILVAPVQHQESIMHPPDRSTSQLT